MDQWYLFETHCLVDKHDITSLPRTRRTWQAIVLDCEIFVKQVILVGGLEHVLFFHILGTIIPTD